MDKFDLIHSSSVIVFQLGFRQRYGILRYSCLAECRSLCGLHIDLNAVSLRSPGTYRVIFDVLIKRSDFAGIGIDFIIIFCISGIKFYIVDICTVVIFRMCCDIDSVRFCDACVLQSDFFRLFKADFCLRLSSGSAAGNGCRIA